MFGWEFGTDPSWGNQKCFGWEAGWQGAQRSGWRCGRAVQKRISIGQTDGTGLGEYTDRVLGGFSGRSDVQRCQNQGCSLICTETPALKDDICY